jgi:hypothetical protein
MTELDHWQVNFAVMHNTTPVVVECGPQSKGDSYYSASNRIAALWRVA